MSIKAFPNGDGGKSIYAVLDSQRWYYYKNGAWQDGGVYQIPAIDAAKMDQIGQYLDNLSRNNILICYAFPPPPLLLLRSR